MNLCEYYRFAILQYATNMLMLLIPNQLWIQYLYIRNVNKLLNIYSHNFSFLTPIVLHGALMP